MPEEQSESELLINELAPSNQEQIRQQIEGDANLGPFLIEWLRNGMNASLAYKVLHPSITDGSARVLGSRLLAKVNKGAILSAFGISLEDYIKQLKEGLAAQFKDESGELIPDHKTRRIYHQVVGKLLEFEI